ncbi:hypothetical protein M409DRAFT_20206 [Zasmidium cellare ATCC 36951]|uniref:DUF1989 domain-containing protein n=1 Tax=Zasmidium cellare ATCC 36951 TaxID=1080233 RepID=A0A6A6CRS8_ZASCE|nr:uncharacterized protein M409DRAFT_20206 [Zasmidium cellare ATCC 36951]KAF2169791.1 hypothetical protein M409DRAFT_20206 [Zasmidium cellare ATCC 36951]
MVFPQPSTLMEMQMDAGQHAASSKPQTHIVKASHGFAFEVKKGDRFRIVDLHGEQVVDFAAWVQSTNLVEKLSMAYTRFHLSGATPAIGECLWTNKDEPILKITDDTVKTHDMTFMSCFPEMYSKQGIKNHRSCASNIAEVMAPYGMNNYLEVTVANGFLDQDPFNIFQNTPNYTLKPLGSSKAGDYIEFEALKDMIAAASCCPYDLGGFNGGKVTDVAVVTGLGANDAS